MEGLGSEQGWGAWCEISKESIKNYVRNTGSDHCENGGGGSSDEDFYDAP